MNDRNATFGELIRDIKAIREERDRLLKLLPELRDCVADCLNSAQNEHSPREARVKFYADLLYQCDAELEGGKK
jgi:uncharacterized membrane protein YkvA (DUF1232 family)